MPIRSKTAAVAAAALLSIMVSAASAADITVIASTAMREVMEELVPMFERANGYKVTLTFLSGAVLPVKMKEDSQAASAKQQEPAKALAKFLTSETAVPVMKKLGLDPA